MEDKACLLPTARGNDENTEDKACLLPTARGKDD
jgi:hypothetical protein